MAGNRHLASLLGWLLFVLLPLGITAAAVPVLNDPASLLTQADRIKTKDHPEFLKLMKQLGRDSVGLTSQQQLYLRYLQAWEIGYQGDYKTAEPILHSIIVQSPDATLRFRAGMTLINSLTIASRYEDAFARMGQLLDQLDQITDKDARVQALGVAAFLYNDAGQYDLGQRYARQMLIENPDAEGTCKGRYLQVQSSYESGRFSALEKQSAETIEACNKASEFLFANAARVYLARYDVGHEQSPAAIQLLQRHYAEVQRIGYPELTADFDASLAQAYWKQGDLALARKYAKAAVADGVKNEFTKSLSSAYELLYRLDKHDGDSNAALAWHEKYMTADKGYLNALSAKALAYQTVKQQVLAKKLQIDTLAKQNKILQLQQALGKKANEASQLWIILLLTLLAFVGFVTYRIKRSQMRFMKLARRDGLTGIFNRQHFVSEADRHLQYCRKSGRDACMVLLDLDHFKAVNDTHGHAVGDRVLKRAVAACQAHLRSTDVFGRLGGEEFGMLLPECALDQVLARVEQMRVSVATASAGEGAPSVQISASFGVSTVANSGYDLRQLMMDADDALYRAKRDGRNRVSLSDSRHDQLSPA